VLHWQRALCGPDPVILATRRFRDNLICNQENVFPPTPLAAVISLTQHGMTPYFLTPRL
jgi:hypothetical protein